MKAKLGNQPVLTAVIYIRVSSKDQLDGYSLESQEKVCRAYADKQGLAVLKLFREEGESAKTADRTELQNLLRYCGKNQGRVGNVIVYKLDRFARNLEDHYALKVILRKCGVTILSATEAIASDPQGQLMEGILSAMAQFDNNIRAQRTAEGMRTALNAGNWAFKANFGYVNTRDAANNKVIVPERKREPIVRFIFEEYAKGIYTFRELAQKAMKLDPTLRLDISPQLLVKILTNPLYCGWISVPKWDICVPGKHEPIVSKELFDKVQFLLTGGDPKKVIRNLNNPDFPLRGVKCGACGHSITGGWTRGKTGRRYAYYNCGKVGCEMRHSISKDDFEGEFTGFLTQLVPVEDTLDILKEAVACAYETELAEVSKQNSKIETELKRLGEQRDSLLELKLKGDLISDEEFKEHRGKFEERIRALQMSRSNSGYDGLDVSKAIDFSFGYIKNLPHEWKALDPADLKVLRKILFPQNVFYNYPGFQTPEACPIFGLIPVLPAQKETLVASWGFEPQFSP